MASELRPGPSVAWQRRTPPPLDRTRLPRRVNVYLDTETAIRLRELQRLAPELVLSRLLAWAIGEALAEAERGVGHE